MKSTTLGTAALVGLVACGGGRARPADPGQSGGGAEPVGLRIPASGGNAYGGNAYGGDAYGGDTGADSDDDATVVGQAPTELVITGRWVTACIPGTTRGEHVRHTFDATDTGWDLRTETFGDAACTRRRFVVRHAGEYGIDGVGTTLAPTWHATFELAARDVTAFDQRFANTLARACAVKLAPGNPMSVLDHGCPGLGLLPRAECAANHDLVAIRDGELRFGRRPVDGDVCSADRRPTELAPLGFAFEWQPVGHPECDALGGMYATLRACPRLAAAGLDQDKLVNAFLQMRRVFVQLIERGTPAAELTITCVSARQSVLDGLARAGCAP